MPCESWNAREAALLRTDGEGISADDARQPASPGQRRSGRPLAKVTLGVIVTVRVRLRAAGGGAKHPRLGPRSGNFAGLKGSRGQFHEKIRRKLIG